MIFWKVAVKLGIVEHAFNPSIQEAKSQADLWKFKDNLVYTSNSRPARAPQWDSLKKEERNHCETRGSGIYHVLWTGMNAMYLGDLSRKII